MGYLNQALYRLDLRPATEILLAFVQIPIPAKRGEDGVERRYERANSGHRMGSDYSALQGRDSLARRVGQRASNPDTIPDGSSLSYGVLLLLQCLEVLNLPGRPRMCGSSRAERQKRSEGKSTTPIGKPLQALTRM